MRHDAAVTVILRGSDIESIEGIPAHETVRGSDRDAA